MGEQGSDSLTNSIMAVGNSNALNTCYLMRLDFMSLVCTHTHTMVTMISDGYINLTMIIIPYVYKIIIR